MLRSLSRYVKRWLQQRDRAIVWRPRELSDHPASLLEPSLSMALAEMWLRKPEMVVVQVGAYDGVTDDPLYDFLMSTPARAILLEPQPEIFLRLQSTYRSRKSVSTVQALMSASDGTEDFYVVAGTRPGDPPWISQLASVRRDTILSHARWCPDLEARVERITVPSIMPATLAARWDLDSVDALVIDAEGADWSIAQLFLQQNFRPGIIYFETKHLSRSLLGEALDTLVGLGFRVAFPGPNLLACRGDHAD